MAKKREKDFGFSNFLSLVKLAKPSIYMVVVGVLGSLLATGMNLILPIFAKDFIDNFSVDALNGKIIIIIVGFFVFRVVFSAFSNYLLSKAGQQVVARLREKNME